MTSLQMGTHPDYEWVQRLRDREPVALDELFRTLYQVAKIAVLKILKDLDNDTLKDITSDAATQAYIRLVEKGGVQKFLFRSAFKTYCYSYVSKEVLRCAKKADTSHLTELYEDQHVDKRELTTVDPDILFERLQPCLEKLQAHSADRHKIIMMRYLQGMSTAETADKIGKSRNNIDKANQRARKNLRDCLESQGYSSSIEVSDSARR